MFGEECVLVIGKGISGLAATAHLERLGTKVLCVNTGERVPREWEEAVKKVVLSPGISPETDMVEHFRRKKIPIIGEIELAFAAEKGQLIAITGTNGKTTTTTLMGEIIKAHLGEERTLVVGNIGVPYTTEVVRSAHNTVTVAEISSFQLETTQEFKPYVSAILNISPDHLDRHHTMEAYARAKATIFKRQTDKDYCVLNYEDAYTESFVKKCPARVVYFSSAQELWDGYFLRGSKIVKSRDGMVCELLDVRKDMKLKGICNVENVMAAIAIADIMKIPWETTLGVIRQFRAVEHRIEYVDTVNGIEYYNDSKATNPDSAIWGLRAMDRPVILIAGGYDKKTEYDSWISQFDGKVKWLVLMGQTGQKIADCAGKYGFSNIKIVNARTEDSVYECFRMATNLADKGDAVLLSPACASYDLFANYEERGRCFKAYVRSLSQTGKEIRKPMSE